MKICSSLPVNIEMQTETIINNFWKILIHKTSCIDKWTGKPAHPCWVNFSKENSCTITRGRINNVRQKVIKTFCYIYTMEQSSYHWNWNLDNVSMLKRMYSPIMYFIYYHRTKTNVCFVLFLNRQQNSWEVV